MTNGTDEIEAAMYTAVDNVTPVECRLILEILFKLLVNVFNNWSVATDQ